MALISPTEVGEIVQRFVQIIEFCDYLTNLQNEKKRMWHSCNYNEYNGHFMIIGGAIRQSAEEDEEILSKHNLEFQSESTYTNLRV